MKLPIFLFFPVFLIFCFIPVSVSAQGTDPNTIKFKSFTPAPTKTPIPTRIPTVTPRPTLTQIPGITNLPTVRPTTGGVVPTIPGTNQACTPANRGFASDCATAGLGLQSPKPRYLVDTSLCTGGVMRPVYNSSFSPPDLTSVNNALGNEFHVWRPNTYFNKCKMDDLRRMLRAVEASNRNCIGFIAHAYRSYAEQQSLWDTDPHDCHANPNSCGTAPPGRSLHQGGIGVDLYCYTYNSVLKRWETLNIPDSFTGRVGQFNFSRPIPGDPPHFNGL